MNEQKMPPETAWADGGGGALWALAPRKVPPTRSAAYVRTSEDGIYLTAAQCRGAAAHLIALADYHEETTPRSAQELPTEDGAVIAPADGCEFILVTDAGGWAFERMTYSAEHDRWYGMTKRGAIAMCIAEQIIPGTWKEDDR